MRQQLILSATLAGALVLSACADKADETVERAFQDVNVIDESNLNDVMLTASLGSATVSITSLRLLSSMTLTS